MEEIPENPYLLASRRSRFSAWLIDTLIILLFTVPLMYFMDGFDGLAQDPQVPPSFEYEIIMFVFTFSCYCAINWKLLKASGQTVGKKLLKIKVVNTDGSPISVQQLIFKRYLFMTVLYYIPIIGALLGTANFLMIFGKQKLALHDRVAKTKVMNAL
ncbi:RDD family protein [Vibrio gallicus]|uniref:RDD family protein n=1 Tax=Vibrio gallicus TaxID=190897 RepID=UPI0021C42B56|nr:RDD family protein [Vibrio gallicus]